MTGQSTRCLDWILRRSGLVLAAWVALAAAAAPGLLEIGHDNSPEVYFVRDDEALARYRGFVATFGDFGALRIAAEGPGLWTRDGLAWLEAIERRAPTLPGVVAAAGLWGYHHPEAGGWPPADPPAYRAEAADDELARQAGWVGRDGEVATILLALRRLSTAERRRLLERLEELVAAPPPGLDARIAGLETINRALDRALFGVLARLFPLVVVLGALAIALALGSLADTATALLFTTFCQIVLFGAMGYAGASLSAVTAILPLLLFVLALATALHLLLEAREQGRVGRGARTAVTATWRRKGWPLLWALLTTGVGFGSLAASRSPPVRSLGLWAAAGIAVILLGALTLYPALLARALRPPAGDRRSPFEACARWLGAAAAERAIRRRRAVHAVFGLLLLAALAGLPRLRVGTGVLEYFRPGHPARAAIQSLERRGVAAVSAELVVRLNEGSFHQREAAGKLRRLAARVRSHPDVLGVVGAADLPPDQTPFLDRARTALLTEDGRAARMTIFVPFADPRRLVAPLAAAEAAAGELLPGAVAELTGHYPMVLAAQRHLLSTLIASLAFTLLAVASVIAVLVRGGRLALAALAPNLWPVTLVLGTMGWLGVPLDGATVMVAAVVLAIAADDTLHYLGGLRADAGRSVAAAAARSTLERIAPAQLLTTLVLILGFGLLAGSSFVPLERFGTLAAGGLAAALAADLVWVPALTAGASRRDLARLAGRRAAPG